MRKGLALFCACFLALAMASACGDSQPAKVIEGVESVGSTSSALLSSAWTATVSMSVARQNHVAALLKNGSVLVAGGHPGNNVPTSSAEVYSPATGTWTTVGPMGTARRLFGACTLANGKVLVVGGNAGLGDVASAELFDPSASTWSATGNLAAAREDFSTTCLSDGRVLVAGGSSASGLLNSAEIYNPTSGTWSSAGTIPAALHTQAAVLLHDGRVLIAGGSNALGPVSTAAIWNPSTNAWTATASMSTSRAFYALNLLSDGRVLAAGGLVNALSANTSTAEIYSPSTGTWSAAASLHTARYSGVSATLAAGPIVVGGVNGGNPLATSESYDSVHNTWKQVATAYGAVNQTATVLSPTSVIVAGGNTGSSATTSAQTYGLLNVFALYAQRSVTLGSSDHINGGDVGVAAVAASGFGPQLVVGSSATVQSNHNLVAPSVSLGSQAQVGDVQTNALTNSGGTLGTQASYPTSMPASPSALPSGSGGSNVTVPALTITTLNPGNYGAVNVTGTLYLNAGNYTFSSVTLANQAHLAGVSGTATVSVAGTFQAGNSVSLSSPGAAPAGQLAISVAGYDSGTTPAFSIGTGALISALLWAPHGTLSLGNSTIATGAFAGFDVKLGTGVTITFQNGFNETNAALAQLEHDTGVVWQETLEPGTPSEITVLLRPEGDPGVALQPGTQPDVAATKFLNNYAAIFAIQDPTTELALGAAHIGPDGIGYATYQQVASGVPVLGGRVTFMFNPQGRIDNVTSHIISGVRGMSTTPSTTEATALATGQAEMPAHFPSGTLGALLPTKPGELFIAPQAGGPARLARGVRALFADQADPLVHYGRDYVVDALTGSILASGSADRHQYKGTGAPVSASGQGSIEQTKKLPLTRQFTAFSSKPPNGPPFFMQQLNPSPIPPNTVAIPIFTLDGALKVQSSPVPIESAKLNSWDTGMVGEGAAVDAYAYFNYILSWWAQRGRASYDNLGATIPILVHYPGLNCNSAYSSSDNQFQVGDCERAGLLFVPDSAGVDIMGHEFQHAVNESVFSGTLFSLNGKISQFLDPDAGALDESLGDVFGQFIESDFHASNSLAYAPTPTLLGESLYALMPQAVGPWSRNLVSPHEPQDGDPRNAQPDAMTDCLYKSGNSDPHANAGIPNRAWSIATFGGIDSTQGWGVDPANSLGMNVSEQLYLSLVQNPPSLGTLAAGGDFKIVANSLIAFARMKYGAPQVTALACAWFGVGVYTSNDALLQGDVDVFSQCASGPETPCTAGSGGQSQSGIGCGAGTAALSSCPGTPCDTAPAGDSCSSDGTTIYTCDGNGGTIAGTFCANGCLEGNLGLAACAGATGPGAGSGSGPCFGLLPGDYCGGNGSGNPSILYSCSKDAVVHAVSCGKGCKLNTVSGGPPAPPPGCSGGGSGSCFSLPVGDYCGDDQVCGDPNALYHCDLNHNATVSKVCATGCTIVSSGSQAGGADQCTGPYSNVPGMDTCNPGPQTPVSSGPGGASVGVGSYGGLILGSGIVCGGDEEGLPSVGNVPDGLYCGNNNTITYCRGGMDRGIRTCPAGCTSSTFIGSDTCSGACAGVISGTACASGGVTLLQCDLSVQVAQSQCPPGDVCGGGGGVPAACGPPCATNANCNPLLICSGGACVPPKRQVELQGTGTIDTYDYAALNCGQTAIPFSFDFSCVPDSTGAPVTAITRPQCPAGQANCTINSGLCGDDGNNDTDQVEIQATCVQDPLSGAIAVTGFYQLFHGCGLNPQPEGQRLFNVTLQAPTPPATTTSAVISQFNPDTPSCLKEGSHPFCSSSSNPCDYEVAKVNSITLTNERTP